MHILDDKNPTSRDSSPVYLCFVPQPDRNHHSRQPCMSTFLPCNQKAVTTMVGLWYYNQSGVTELLIMMDHHYDRICFKSVKTIGTLHS